MHVDDLKAEIERAHEGGDTDRLAALQEEFRRSGHTYRIGSAPRLVGGDPARLASRAAPRAGAPSARRRSGDRQWTVMLGWSAWCDVIGADKLDSPYELAGAILGRLDYTNQRFIVEAISWNEHYGTEDSAGFDEHDKERHLARQRQGIDSETREETDERRVILGIIHSHPEGDNRPSLTDLRTFRRGADDVDEPFLAIIAAPNGERWEQGWPVGPDWSEPCLAAYVSLPRQQSVPETTIMREPKWLWALHEERKEVARATRNS